MRNIQKLDTNITIRCLFRLQCNGSYGFPNIIFYSYLHSFKAGLHLAVRFVMHIMKFPLRRLMKKTHLVQLAAPLFTSCNVLIYYRIILPALFIYLIMRTPYSLNYKADSEPDDGMQWTNATII